MDKNYKLKYIRDNYKSQTNKEIGEHLGLSSRQVWSRAHKLGITNKQKPTFEITSKQNQIILSGIIGDGRLKKNGRFGYCYREVHAIDEEDYLKWKFDNLHPMTKTTTIRDIPARRPTQLPQKGFVTTNTPTLISYVDMTKLEIISQLKPLGLCLLLMDDGWVRIYSQKSASLHLSVESLTNEERELLVNMYINELGVEAWSTNKNKCIAIGTEGTEIVYEVLTQYMDKNTDVLKKKFPMCY